MKRSISDIIVKKPGELQEETVAPKETLWNKETLRNKKQSRQYFLTLGLVLIFIGGLIFLFSIFFPRAEIKLFLKQYPLSFEEEVLAKKDFAQPEINQLMKLPAQVFYQEGELSLKFPAKGTEELRKKAEGQITIYNKYSSKNQILVKNTRFQTLDGRIYHLKKQVVVPGALVEAGQIIASRITTQVVADKAGQEYNLEAGAKFKIPAFKGTRKYEGFFAESRKPIKGGFIGQIAIPTEQDISEAKKTIRNVLKENLKARVFNGIPLGFKFLKEAENFEIIEEKITKEADKQGNFSVYLKAKYEMIVFKEEQLRNLLTEKLRDEPQKELKDFEINYQEIVFDLAELSFKIKGQLVFQSKVDLQNLKTKVLGKDKDSLRNIIFALPGIEQVQIKIQPFFFKRIPKNQDKVIITAE